MSGFSNFSFGNQPATTQAQPTTVTNPTQQSTLPTFGSTAVTTNQTPATQSQQQQQPNSLLGSTTTIAQPSNLTSNLNNKPATTGFSLDFSSVTQTTNQPTTQTSITNNAPTTSTQFSSLSTSQPLTTTATTTANAQTTQQQQQQQQIAPAATQQPTQMTFKQLEGYINVWLNELNQMESDFQKQSQTINSWDSLLVNNALKITNLNENLDMLKEEHKRIDQQLDFVISQQNELEQLLEPLEKKQIDFNVNDTASTEREFTYSLVDTVSNDLQGIGTELQNFIKKLNETKANQDLNDPLSSISKILNSHIDALQYIEHQISVLKRNVET